MAAKKLTPAQIERIGLLLFGENWPREMRLAFGRSPTTMRDWRENGAPRASFIRMARTHCADMMRNATKTLDMLDRLDPDT